MSGVGLVVSPMNLKFQVPFLNNQKRQLSLLNVGGKPLVYSIELENSQLFQVFPSRGEVAEFNTDEVFIIMKSAGGEQVAGTLKVKYMEKGDLEEAAGENWADAKSVVVNIALENCVENETELKKVYGLDGNPEPPVEVMQEHVPLLCNACAMRRANAKAKSTKTSWTKYLFWAFALLFLLVAVVYCLGWANKMADLSVEMIF